MEEATVAAEAAEATAAVIFNKKILYRKEIYYGTFFRAVCQRRGVGGIP